MKSKMILCIVFVLVTATHGIYGQTDEPLPPSANNPKAAELVKKAILLESAMFYISAIDTYKEVLKLEPKDFASMNSIAGIFGILQKPEEEVVWAQRAIEASPRYWQGYINLGNGLAMQGEFEKANKAYLKAAELAPKNPLPIYSLGVVAENQRNIPTALEYYRKSLDLDPKFQNGLFSAAAMHANLKQFAEAKALLAKLLEINPKDADARQMLQQIEQEKP